MKILDPRNYGPCPKPKKWEAGIVQSGFVVQREIPVLWLDGMCVAEVSTLDLAKQIADTLNADDRARAAKRKGKK